MSESDTVAIIVAAISAATSALATVLTLYMTRRNNSKIEDIRRHNNKEIEAIKKGNSEQLLRLEQILNLETERMSLEKRLANSYLLQLQDAVETLWGRFDNIHGLFVRVERSNLEDNYYERSTLYALACLLAYNRILLLDGVYAQIEFVTPGLGIALRNRLQDFDFSLDSIIPESGFYRYNRLALAESVIERVEGRLVIRPYIEFNKQYKKEDLSHAESFVSLLRYQAPKLDALKDNLMDIAKQLEKATRIEPRIKEIVASRREAKEKKQNLQEKAGNRI